MRLVVFMFVLCVFVCFVRVCLFVCFVRVCCLFCACACFFCTRTRTTAKSAQCLENRWYDVALRMFRQLELKIKEKALATQCKTLVHVCMHACAFCVCVRVFVFVCFLPKKKCACMRVCLFCICVGMYMSICLLSLCVCVFV